MTGTRKLQTIAALAGALAFVNPWAAQAQDTSSTRDSTPGQQARSDTTGQDSTTWGYSTDSAAVQNPAGYRGMERDTTMFPPDKDTVSPGAGATDRTSQRARQDSLEEAVDQNPPGYRGMERPAGLDSAQSDTGGAKKAGVQKHDKAKTKKGTWKKTSKQAATDTTQQDSTIPGRAAGEADTVQNPAGYRGMERDTNMISPQNDSSVGGDATNRVNQRARQDSLEGDESQNPPEYQGMERPSALDSAEVHQGDSGSARAD